MKRTRIFSLTLAAALLAGFALPVPTRAQDDEEDGPGRGVARLSLMNGDVSVRRGDSGDWIAGAVNAPLLVEDRINTGPGSRAEVQFDYYHRIRLAEASEIRLSELEWRRYQIQVARGTVTFAAIKGGDAQVEISTPGASVRPTSHGSYRITVQPDGTAEITIRSGEAEIFTPSGSQRLRSGQAIMVRAASDGPSEFRTISAAPRDAWDQFNEQRDKELRRGGEYYSSYVSRDVYGAEDLYGHGTWVNVAPYGNVWRPSVAVGWAPYRDGRWVWLDWYGWSWVSYDPWGWAPYHYGRWFFNAGAWYWYPGAYRARHYWSPGLVAWFGWSSWGGVGVGVGFGGPAYGWVPLAPYERCYRWWGPRYYNGYRNTGFGRNNITVVNNVNVTNIYRNARVHNAVTVINGNDFSRGRSFRASTDDLNRAGVVRGAVPVAPGRDNLRYNDRQARPIDTARGGSRVNERFFSRNTPSSVDRVPFDQQRSTLERASRSAFGGAGRSGGDSVRGGANAGESGFRGRSAEPANGWRNFGDPRGGSGRTADAANGNGSGGWRTDSSTVRGTERGFTGRSGEAVTGGTGGNATSGNTSGWRRFGDPGSGNRGDTAERSSGSARGGESTGRPSGSAERSSGSGWRSSGGNSERSVAPTTGGDGPRSSGPESSGRGWSTGGARSGGETRTATPGSDRSSGSGRNWSTGGSRSGGETRSVTPPSTGGNAGGSGRSWSTGGGRSGGETRSVAPSTGGGARGAEPRMSAPRSEPSGGGRQFSAPSTGGGSGGGRSSGGGMRAPSSFGGGGGGMRSAPSGGGGGGMRSAPSGGGSSWSGGGRSSGGGGGGGARSGGGSAGGGGGARGGGRR